MMVKVMITWGEHSCHYQYVVNVYHSILVWTLERHLVTCLVGPYSHVHTLFKFCSTSKLLCDKKLTTYTLTLGTQLVL